ncbi:hypothetical protein HU200_034397 [Digitaria exilis]|uniref:Peptidase A1 domain-containing protein n=1 Tax=Digitaria exilis TaxID=1010633 RepID=A0A835BVR9_9POAL|nr:hypothetical protein HU200_034397 [Digitaria exilis]
MTLSIGTPALLYLAIVDTGSDLIWTLCALLRRRPPSRLQQVRAAMESVVTTTLPEIDGSSDDSTGARPVCFELPSTTPAMPIMTLHFDGADMVLPVDSYMVSYREPANPPRKISLSGLCDPAAILCGQVDRSTQGPLDINTNPQNPHRPTKNIALLFSAYPSSHETGAAAGVDVSNPSHRRRCRRRRPILAAAVHVQARPPPLPSTSKPGRRCRRRLRISAVAAVVQAWSRY